MSGPGIGTAWLDPASLGEPLSERELCPEELLRGQEEAFRRDIERLRSRSGEFVTVTCPACGSDRWTRTLEKEGFVYVTCGPCGTLYMNPRPAPAVMADYYRDSENYRYWAKYIFPASEEARRNKIHRLWLERVSAYCHRFGIRRGVLVEVGAGFGIFGSLVQASSAFREVVAVEPNPEMARACRERNVRVLNKPIEEVDQELEAVDVAVAFELIEHLFEPRRLLEQCRRVIRSGGLLVLSCPNGQGFDISLLGSASLAVDAEHVNLFNPGSLMTLVEAYGFEVLEVTTPGRLDAELVRTAIQEGKFDVSDDAFLRRVLVDEWERLGWPFQQFLAANGLSSHMWLAARRK